MYRRDEKLLFPGALVTGGTTVVFQCEQLIETSRCWSKSSMNCIKEARLSFSRVLSLPDATQTEDLLCLSHRHQRITRKKRCFLWTIRRGKKNCQFPAWKWTFNYDVAAVDHVVKEQNDFLLFYFFLHSKAPLKLLMWHQSGASGDSICCLGMLTNIPFLFQSMKVDLSQGAAVRALTSA